MDMPQAERQKYAEIFTSLNPINGYITGNPTLPLLNPIFIHLLRLYIHSLRTSGRPQLKP